MRASVTTGYYSLVHVIAINAYSSRQLEMVLQSGLPRAGEHTRDATCTETSSRRLALKYYNAIKVIHLRREKSTIRCLILSLFIIVFVYLFKFVVIFSNKARGLLTLTRPAISAAVSLKWNIP